MVGVGPDGFFVRSADGKYQFRFRGYTQLDSRWFSEADETALPDTFYFRRVRPIFEGTLASFIDFRIMPDFANSTLVLQDAYTNLRFSPEVQLQVGKFKSPFGLERLESVTAM
jgi:phosphate-selective porin OprO/OprP